MARHRHGDSDALHGHRDNCALFESNAGTVATIRDPSGTSDGAVDTVTNRLAEYRTAPKPTQGDTLPYHALRRLRGADQDWRSTRSPRLYPCGTVPRWNLGVSFLPDAGKSSLGK